MTASGRLQRRILDRLTTFPVFSSSLYCGLRCCILFPFYSTLRFVSKRLNEGNRKGRFRHASSVNNSMLDKTSLTRWRRQFVQCWGKSQSRFWLDYYYTELEVVADQKTDEQGR